MKKLLKIIFVLLLLIVVAAGAFVFLFDANKYKPELAELAQAYTGRPIALNGEVKLSLYPWIGVQLENVTIGNALDGSKIDESGLEFSKNDFATIERFDINIKIIPLLTKRLEIEKLVVNRLAVDFELNTAGENNWSDLFGGPEKPEPESGLNGFIIGGIEVTDSRLSWFDANTGKRFNLSSMNITTKAFVEGQPLPLILNALIESNQPAWKATTSVKTQLAFNPSSPVFNAKKLQLEIKAQLPVEEMEPVTFTLAADARVNVKKKTARLNKATFSFLDVMMSGTFNVQNIFSIPSIQGPIKVNEFEVLALAKHFNLEVPELAKPESLKDISLSAKFKTDFDSISLDDLSAKVDNSKVSGFFRIEKLNAPTRVIRYDLDVDKINWNDYALIDNESNNNETLLPLGFIRTVDLQGVFNVASVLIDDMSVSSLHVPLKLRKSVLTANPMSMLIGAAKVRAAMELNARALPVARASIKISNLDTVDSFNPLFVKIMGNKPLVMEGIINSLVKFKTTGKSIQAHRKSLNGSFNVDMKNLVLKGVDLNYSAKKVVSDYAKTNNFRTRRAYLPAYDPGSKSDFKRLSATFKMSGKQLSSTDISLVSDEVNITGAGSIDFLNKSVNYRSVLDRHVKDRIDIRDKLLDHPMEYVVQGGFENLTTQFDLEKFDLRAGRLLHVEAKARRIRAINNKNKNSW